MEPRRILMGVIGRPHGVRGLVHVQSYTADPADLATYAPLLDEGGRTWTLAWRTPGIAELRGPDNTPLPDRTAAERLTNTRLYIDRDRLPPAGEDGSIGTTTVLLAAVEDALKPLGVTVSASPLTPWNVRRLIDHAADRVEGRSLEPVHA